MAEFDAKLIVDALFNLYHCGIKRHFTLNPKVDVKVPPNQRILK